VISGQLSTKNLEVTVGDTVEYTISRGKPFVEKTLAPRNCLTRSYFGEIRRIVANVDHLFIGAAVPPLFNTTFIDRLLALARLEDIPATLLVNKVDLGLENASLLTSTYERLGVDLLYTSALSGEGMDALQARLAEPTLRLAVLAGISGVGKSTIINVLIPSAQQRVGEVSEKTGQGRQTTTQPMGHLYTRANCGPLIVVDLPGIQSFGVAHLDKTVIKAGFAEIEELGQRCKYSDCSHTKEEECEVKASVSDGRIAESRYQSYCDILAEIDAAKPY
jgi:ribosome biogenesis GTPase